MSFCLTVDMHFSGIVFQLNSYLANHTGIFLIALIPRILDVTQDHTLLC